MYIFNFNYICFNFKYNFIFITTSLVEKIQHGRDPYRVVNFIMNFNISTLFFKIYQSKLIKDIHNSWLYCFTNPPELGTRVSLSHRQPNVLYIFNYKMFHQEASVETIKLIKINY